MEEGTPLFCPPALHRPALLPQWLCASVSSQKRDIKERRFPHDGFKEACGCVAPTLLKPSLPQVPPGKSPPSPGTPSSLDAHQLCYGRSVDHQLLVSPQEELKPGGVGVLVVRQLLLLQVLGDDGFDLQRQRQCHSMRGVSVLVQVSQPEASPSSPQGAQKSQPTCPKWGWRQRLMQAHHLHS